MVNGANRFEFYLAKLDSALITAAKAENPAKQFYEAGGRTVLFMLEGLAKLYAGMHDRKIFKKQEKRFKEFEDLLGAVDYYDGFAKDFLADPTMPSTVRMFLEEKRDEKLSELNELMIDKKWINHDPLLTSKIRNQLSKANWKSPENEKALIRDFYINAVKNIKSFYAKSCRKFKDIELQVHSLRRKLRWLSIYPQALQGLVQLRENETDGESLKKYLTPEIVNSPFNKMPLPGENTSPVFLNNGEFLALSWMIAELGKLKDAGLRILAATEGVKATQFVKTKPALLKSFELNNKSEHGFGTIMTRAKEISEAFFNEKILNNLVSDAAE